jgi:hypothetical protein
MSGSGMSLTNATDDVQEAATGGRPAVWHLPSSAELLRRHRLRRLLDPFRERDFVYSAYDELLERLADVRRFEVVPLREFPNGGRGAGRVVVSLRHDVDERLDSALRVGRLEHGRGLRSTYLVLHTAAYYERRADLLSALRTLQDEFGHEIGWHNDLVALECETGVDTRAYLARELAWLRGGGIDIRGVSAHGSYLPHRYGFLNRYFFEDVSSPLPGFPHIADVPLGNDGSFRITKGTLAEFGFEYDADDLAEDVRYSDARFDAAGRRWHPRYTNLDLLRPGERVVMLVHPCHWDASLGAKVWRTVGRAARAVMRRGRPAPTARG